MISDELRINLEGENNILVVVDDGEYIYSIDSIRFDRNGLEGTESTMPIIVLELGGRIEVE
jgi:hypothetical protein